MIDWLKRKEKYGASQLRRIFTQHGLLIQKNSSSLADSIMESSAPLSPSDVGDLLNQLEDDGYALVNADGWFLGWDSVFKLLDHSGYGATSWALLQIPSIRVCSPTLVSDKSLADLDFCISIADWRDENGE